ncbi:MAG: rhomboid family intramembrane serine protease [Chlamydiota bacterium]
MRLKKILLYSCTFWLFSLCVLLFAWNEKEAYTLKKTVGELSLAVGLTPVQRNLLFDYPKMMACMNRVIIKYNLRSEEDLSKLPVAGQRQFRQAEDIPVWNGVITETMQAIHTGRFDYRVPLFEKIREGQMWRLFSPALLHKDIIHLVFNMSWLWLLGLQIERRLARVRFLLLVLLIGIFSNTAQYLMGGPYFLGFSGVVVGLTGFIWTRQKKAPREAYPLPRATALFVFYFVLVMMGLEVVTVAAQAVFSIVIPLNIANTAHVVGGLAGLVLGRCVFFSRREI